MPKNLPQKFFIKENYTIATINAPESFLSNLLVPLPEGVTTTSNLEKGPFDIQIYFTKTKAEVDAVIQTAISTLKPGCYIWFCYPKGGAKAKIKTDLNRDSLWEISASNGLKPVHQISIDETWSGLRFRLED
jgi:hypothetical protein